MVSAGTLNNVEIITDGYGIYVAEANSEATVSNCTFNVGNAKESSAPAAAVAVAYNAKTTVTGYSIECNDTIAALYVYLSGGEITYSNNTITGTYDN